MTDLYRTDAYASSNPTWHEEDAPWKAKHLAKAIRNSKITSNTICEVGCGTGQILVNLAEQFPDSKLFGYEISPYAYDRAKRNENEQIKFQFGDFLSMEAPFYDIIILADVFEHVDDYVSFIKAMKGRSRYKLFHIPLDLSVQSVFRVRPILNMRKDVGHLHYFFKDTALATLEYCGYRVIDHFYTASRLELPNQALSSQFMKLPRRIAYALNPDLAVRVLGGYSLLVLAE